jgi:hypothetical protein
MRDFESQRQSLIKERAKQNEIRRSIMGQVGNEYL